MRSCKVLLITNIIFWAAMALSFSFSELASHDNYLLIKILLFLEPAIFAVILFGLSRRDKVIYALSIPFAVTNAILSITDDMGIYDIISLILSLAVFVNLLFIWKHVLTKIPSLSSD